MEQSKNRSTGLKLIIVWVVIIFLASFWLTVRATSEPVNLVVTPEVPRQGEPILATVKLNNPLPHDSTVEFQFYANGKLIKAGITTLAPASGKIYQYAFESPLPMGEQINFTVRAQSGKDNYEKSVSTPPYPPQIFSSFISFASFSTTVMSSMSTMTYYKSTFGDGIGLNLGIILTGVLLVLLVFLELSVESSTRGPTAILSRLRLRFNTITWILFIIFIGIVYTTVIAILVI
jgi:hypothetical protein